MGTFADRSVDGWPVSEDPPDPDDRIIVDPDGHIRLPYTPDNLKAHGEFVAVWSRHMRALGRPIIVTQEMDIKVAMHRCATARFGTDPKASVLDPFCRVWDLDNLHVVDASFPPSSTGFDPSLTIVAQALRDRRAYPGPLAVSRGGGPGLTTRISHPRRRHGRTTMIAKKDHARLFDLSGREAGATGGSRGIGRAAAEALRAQGADVAVVVREAAMAPASVIPSVPVTLDARLVADAIWTASAQGREGERRAARSPA